MITITTDLDIISSGVMPVIHLSQYDSDFSLVFNIFASRGTFTMPSGTTAEIRGTKTDGNGYSASATVDENTVTVTGDVQLTAVPGRNIYEITLYKDEKRLNTINFVLNVEKAALDSSTITSESVLRELNDIIEGAETATEAAAAAEAAAATFTTDPTLSVAGRAADALAAGKIFTDDAKDALLACLAHVAWIDEEGQDYYDALAAELYPDSFPKITATLELGTHIVCEGDSLDSLKDYLTVVYYATEESAGVTLSDSDYILSGILEEGMCSISVVYGVYITTFSVLVYDFYNITNWSTANLLQSVQGNIDDSHLPAIWTNPGNARRAILVVDRGKSEFINYQTSQPFSPSRFPIPVPAGATVISITCPVTVRPNVIIWQYSNGGYSKVGSGSGWLAYGGGSYNIPSPGTDLFATVQFEANSQVISPPTPVTIVYTV